MTSFATTFLAEPFRNAKPKIRKLSPPTRCRNSYKLKKKLSNFENESGK